MLSELKDSFNICCSEVVSERNAVRVSQSFELDNKCGRSDVPSGERNPCSAHEVVLKSARPRKIVALAHHGSRASWKGTKGRT